MPRQFHFFILLVLFPILIQCSPNYDPDCRIYGPGNAPAEETLIDQAHIAWNILKDKKRVKEWPQATIDYNKAVYAIIERVRCEEKSGTLMEYGNHAFVVHNSYSSRFPDSRVYEEVIPADRIELSRVEESFIVHGVGVPVIGVINRDKGDKLQYQVSDAEGIHSLTAVLDFGAKVKGKPTLQLIPRLQFNHFTIGGQRHNLAADFSAAIDYLWERSKVDDTKLLGLFRPSDSFDTMGLFFQEPYDPEKIPVVFTHGLQSSPATFANLTNRLLSSPEIRKNYQFWFFGYPTGVSWVITSAKFRDSISKAREKFDPGQKHKSFDKMVLVGHSMGGLITRYSMSDDSWGIIRYALKEEERDKLCREYLLGLQQQKIGLPELQQFGKQFDFLPLSYPKRVVFLATPHKGSDFATNWIARLGIALIELPQNLLEETYRIVTLNKNILILNPDKLVEDMTSIAQLSPGNVAIQGIDGLRINKNIPIHSVIGDRGRGDTPHSSDGFVKYGSSHLDWSTTEEIVPSGHSVQDDPKTATELHRILCEHLKIHRGASAFRFKGGKPAPSVCRPTGSGKTSEESFDPGTNFIPIPE